MTRSLTEKEIEILGTGFKLLMDNIVVIYCKEKYMKGVYKVYRLWDNPHDSNSYNYLCNSIQELKGFFDGYFKGLNVVFGDVRK